MSLYDLTQTVYLFSMISNASCTQKGTRQELADFLTLAATTGGPWQPHQAKEPIMVKGFLANTNKQLIGQDWSIVWGPAICVRSGRKAQNAMLVAHSPSQNTYVVAIAGTNMHSCYDWVFEDGMVGGQLMAHFPVNTGTLTPTPIAANADVAQVSWGTAIGINNLLERMYDANGRKVRLDRFLMGLTGQPGARIIFTGHSLGGALSSTLALQLLPQLDGNWTSKGGQVLVMPTAGPSPGNGRFSDAWGAAFPPVAVPVNPGNQVNHLNVPCIDAQDVVPHAWDYILTENPVVPTGYPTLSTPYYVFDTSGWLKKIVQTQLGKLDNSTKVPWVMALLDVIKKAQAAGHNGNMKRLPNARIFTGAFPITIWLSKQGNWGDYMPPAGNVFGTSAQFGDGIAAVHVWQYHQFFALDPRDVVRPT